MTLPPGRAKLVTKPSPTGSFATTRIIGVVDVARFASMAAAPEVTMTSTLSRTNSAAISAKRVRRPSAQRYSIATVRPSIQPSSRSRSTNASVHEPQLDREPVPRKPIVGSFAGCCAPAVTGHVTAAPPSSVMNSRPSHSITSSARASNLSGIGRRSAFAALRLITSSNLVGCKTGRSPGFSPLRMRPT